MKLNSSMSKRFTWTKLFDNIYIYFFVLWDGIFAWTWISMTLMREKETTIVVSIFFFRVLLLCVQMYIRSTSDAKVCATIYY